MLSSADLDLVQRDPAIPGLAIVLDPLSFVARLRATAPDREIGQAQCSYIRYKPGTTCLVAYQLDVAGSIVDLYAKAYRPDAWDQLPESRKHPGVPGPLGPGRFVLDPSIAVSTFPNDWKLNDRLRNLERLVDPASRRKVCRRTLPDRRDIWNGEIRQIVYKPERRFVAQLRLGEEVHALFKVYTDLEFPKVRINANAFHSTGPLYVQKCLGYSDRYRVLANEWVPGGLLNEVLSAPELHVATISIVGAALAALHAQDPPGLSPHTPEKLARTLADVAMAVGFLCPRLAKRAQDLSLQLSQLLADEPAIQCPVHGDFHSRQVLLADDRATIIDYDEAGRGAPGIDLGNFVAHLERDALRGNLPSDRVEALIESFLNGYREAANQQIPGRLEPYIATGLLKLAPHPFRNREPDWPERVEQIVQRAEDILRGIPRRSLSRTQRRRESPLDRTNVVDPFGVASDAKMPFLAQAIRPNEALPRIVACLRDASDARGAGAGLQEIRVIRYKAERRCLIEYDLQLERFNVSPGNVTLVGKSRSRRVDEATFQLMKSLWRSSFAAEKDNLICVPEPVGIIPSFQMWVQHKAPGTGVIHHLIGPGGAELAARVAEAVHKVHEADISPQRSHMMADELRILHTRLAQVVQTKPEWANRIDRLLEACDRLGATVPSPRLRGIHRDFYHDHVLVDGPRLYLLDFDLYCRGDPALDIGNFLGHLIEWGLRTRGVPDALADCTAAMEERFLALSGPEGRTAVSVYTTLTLARHIYLSTQFADRRPFTEALLDLCEDRLG